MAESVINKHIEEEPVELSLKQLIDEKIALVEKKFGQEGFEEESAALQASIVRLISEKLYGEGSNPESIKVFKGEVVEIVRQYFAEAKRINYSNGHGEERYNFAYKVIKGALGEAIAQNVVEEQGLGISEVTAYDDAIRGVDFEFIAKDRLGIGARAIEIPNIMEMSVKTTAYVDVGHVVFVVLPNELSPDARANVNGLMDEKFLDEKNLAAIGQTWNNERAGYTPAPNRYRMVMVIGTFSPKAGRLDEAKDYNERFNIIKAEIGELFDIADVTCRIGREAQKAFGEALELAKIKKDGNNVVIVKNSSGKRPTSYEIRRPTRLKNMAA